MKKIKRTALLLLVACLLLSHIPFLAAAEDDSLMLADAKKGVVQIWGAGYSGSKYSGYPEALWTGTGFAVGDAGEDSDVFLTNWHVATGEAYDLDHVRIWILLDNATFNSYGEPNPEQAIECEILRTTTGYPDVAVIKTLEPVQGFKALPLHSAEDVLDGARIYALGYPGVVDEHSSTYSGVDDITITTGIISKHMTMTSAGDTKVLMHDAHIQSGNSGGPLVTSAGAVVGLNTYGFGKDTSTEYSCAVYVDYAMEMLNDLGIAYDVYTKDGETEQATEETKSEEVDEETEGEEDGEEEESNTILLAGIGAAVAVAVIAVVVVVMKNRKKANQPVPVRVEEMVPAPAAKPIYEQPLHHGFMLRSPDGSINQITAAGAYIGRDPSCQIRLPENTKGVSRRHCRLDVRNGNLILTDVGSTYGTFVNGQKIPANTPVTLSHGSSFYLATQNITFTVH